MKLNQNSWIDEKTIIADCHVLVSDLPLSIFIRFSFPPRNFREFKCTTISKVRSHRKRVRWQNQGRKTRVTSLIGESNSMKKKMKTWKKERKERHLWKSQLQDEGWEGAWKCRNQIFWQRRCKYSQEYSRLLCRDARSCCRAVRYRGCSLCMNVIGIRICHQSLLILEGYFIIPSKH